MEIKTFDHWDQEVWEQVAPLYTQAFGTGAKPEHIIRNMFEKQSCFLHVVWNKSTVIGMSITGHIKEGNTLLIDYLAVLEVYRQQGIGLNLMEYIKNWASSLMINTIILEVEADLTPVNRARIRFWEKCGFTLTDYVHQYIWVPEPYQAMIYSIGKGVKIHKKMGEDIFHSITQFHRKSYKIN